MTAYEVTVIDYGVGNLLSVKRGLEHVGAKVNVSSDPETILAATKVVLPGVGAFPNAMQALYNLDLIWVIEKFAKLERPLLAICLGMQLLMEESEEFALTPGLGLIPGRVIPVPAKNTDGNFQKIPHIGWSALIESNDTQNWGNTLLRNNKRGEAAYFVHSFMVQPADPMNQVAHAVYGGHRIPAVISKGKITGCQFHPEKSGLVGLKILESFIKS
jgi:imidazole glycerol-phosphate synthase subunit HisH